MKLYSDEESDYICRDSRAVPLALRDQVFNLIMDDNHVSLFNPLGYQKRTYHTPTNVNLYSEAVSLQMGIEPAGFINEYNKRYDVWYKAMQDREDRNFKERLSNTYNDILGNEGDIDSMTRIQSLVRGRQSRSRGLPDPPVAPPAAPSRGRTTDREPRNRTYYWNPRVNRNVLDNAENRELDRLAALRVEAQTDPRLARQLNRDYGMASDSGDY